MWNPDTYRHFQAERDRPFFDLLAQVRLPFPQRVVDLGCGDGHLTAALGERWPRAEVTGVDSSPEMLRDTPVRERLRFVQADLRSWAPAVAPDLILSNAALQWVPDHPRLIPRLAGRLAPGAVFAFQLPGNFAAPSHQLLAELRAEPGWLERLGASGPDPLPSLDPQDYADLLAPLGFRVNAWETTYLHLLHGPDPALNWVRGAALRPVLSRLEPAKVGEFEAEYGRRLREAYPEGPAGTPFPFRRVFVVAERAG